MRILLLVTAFLLVLVMSSSVLACDCMTGSPEESFRSADVVFEGEVIRVSQASEGALTSYVFYVNKVLKGPPVREITIISMSTDCDATFGSNMIYRVYANEHEGKLISGSCSGNQILKTNTAPTSNAVIRSTFWQLWYVKVLSIAAIALVLILLVHFLTRQRFDEPRHDRTRA